MRDAANVTKAPAEVARVTYASTGTVAGEQRVLDLGAGGDQAAERVHVQHDGAGVAGLGFGDGAGDEVGHALVDGPADGDDLDRPLAGGRQGSMRPGREDSGEQAERHDQAAGDHERDYRPAPQRLRGSELFGDDLADRVAVGQPLELWHDRLHDGALVAALGRQRGDGVADDGPNLLGRFLGGQIGLQDLALAGLLRRQLVRPALPNCSIESLRCLTSFCTTASWSASDRSAPASMRR